MYLASKDMADLFNDQRGINDDFSFYTVTDKASFSQPMGLFVRLNEDSGELLEAIANGAIAAVWDAEEMLPQYTPNYFPVFFTNDSAEAIKEIIKLYNEKLDGETNSKMEITNFKFSNKKLLNKNKQSYDIAVILEKLTNKMALNKDGRG
ncbi:hypothetical protein [Neobacillus vireti]|uniref:Solute-binding protein family 3/N-terminal domain-containing protein n=1 Tax=Neobacillus vireti LMG 21834 TaxID=1131730 RepID=A0AB94ILN9_9BACI|nr:hypothetical protein [Neobacillus vireti]ETI67981.1 hypothetical protein BAVI_15046 [Neobacillus vireti LMG 21834]KLT19442.1 hypothetical protein AA980_02250 [Neobacillus vireti]